MTEHELSLKVDDAVKGRNEKLWRACCEVARCKGFLIDPSLTGKQMVEKAIGLMDPKQREHLGVA